MRFAIDAMGGDHAPRQIVLGAIAAARKWPQCALTLVGDRARVEDEIKAAGEHPANLGVHHASQVVGMDEHVKDVIRRKPDSSLHVAVGLVASGKADGIISAGHTGAAVGTCLLALGTLPGIRRPGIAVPMPTEKGFTTLIDVGANIYCKPEHLLQYAHMGVAYARILRKLDRPTVGLLSIGEEEGKGNDLVLQTRELLAKAPFPFHGNVEGNDIFKGTADVIVCEGFVGNTVLKSCEGCAEAILRIAGAEMSSLLGPAGGGGDLIAGLGKKLLGKIRARVDYAQYGGAPLLGVNGLCIIGHGRSESLAVENAVRVAIELHQAKLNECILASLSQP